MQIRKNNSCVSILSHDIVPAKIDDKVGSRISDEIRENCHPMVSVHKQQSVRPQDPAIDPCKPDTVNSYVPSYNRSNDDGGIS